MQDFRYVGLDILTQAASTRRYPFLFLSQLAYNSEILSKFVNKNRKFMILTDSMLDAAFQ